MSWVAFGQVVMLSGWGTLCISVIINSAIGAAKKEGGK